MRTAGPSSAVNEILL